jgi:glycosyltransferase involved in cell wall biosynthesis
MRILYIHQYFASRKGKTGTRSYEFGRYLAGRGHEVTMLTSGLANAEFPVCRNEPCCEYRLDGMRVISIAAAYNDPNLGTALSGWRRMLQFHRFAKLAVEVGRCLGKPEVVFATHTPLPVGLAGLELSRYFEVPFVFEVRDLWPEALVNVGALTNPAAVWWLRRMARHIYRTADHIVALSPGMKDGIVRTGVTSEKVTVIPNGSDLDLFHPGLDGRAARERLGLGQRFAAIYFGAMGLANGLEYVIEAARVLAARGTNQIVLVLLGGGGRRDELESLAAAYGLSNVVFARRRTRETHAWSPAAMLPDDLPGAKEHTWSPIVFDGWRRASRCSSMSRLAAGDSRAQPLRLVR